MSHESALAALSAGESKPMEAQQPQQKQQPQSPQPGLTKDVKSPAASPEPVDAKNVNRFSENVLKAREKRRQEIREKETREKSGQSQFEQRMKQKELEFSAKEEEYKKKLSIYDTAKKSPLQAMKELGFEYKDITNAMLNDGQVTPDREIKSMKQEFEDYKKSVADKETKQREEDGRRQQEHAERVIQDYRENINDFVDEHSEEYDLIIRRGEQDSIFATIKLHHERTGKALSIKEAADLVEKHIEKETELLLSESPKLKSRYQLVKMIEEQKAGISKDSSTLKSEPVKEAPKTLTNYMHSTPTASLLPSATQDERMKRALAALGI